MTDNQALFSYRLNQSAETLNDARQMLQNNIGHRSIINRAYYSLFYVILALFLKAGINLNTSKHAGVISAFDKEFARTNKINSRYSKILHRMFKARQECDYQEFAQLSREDAVEFVAQAEDFCGTVRAFMDTELG